jgi:G3E family GTPase
VTVPLVIVTGFLGAGKTTLVNALLARRAARGATGKIGVVVNELGAIGIDGALLAGNEAQQVELPGGCVCCVLGDELDRTLIDLVRRNPALEAIVLETTGVAEPLPIAWAVRREGVRELVRLAAVVTVVDAENFLTSRSVSSAVAPQVAYADILLVTKAELAGEPRVDEVVRAVKELAPRAEVRLGTAAEFAAWLEIMLADPDVARARSAEESPETASGHVHVHDEACRDADTHAHGVDSVVVDVPGEVDLEELEDALGQLPANYVRIKGIVRVGGGWYAVHRVGLRVSSERLGQNPGGLGRLVALGSDLDRTALQQCITTAAIRVNMA